MDIQFNQEFADKILGKTVIIGKTYLNKDGEMEKQHQWFGTVVEVDSGKVLIKLHGSDEVMSLPPTFESWHELPPGVYRFRSTGEEIFDPNYQCRWIVESN